MLTGTLPAARNPNFNVLEFMWYNQTHSKEKHS